MVKAQEIKIVVSPDGEISYTSSLPPVATVYFLEFVKHDLMARSRSTGEKKQILVPTLVPPTRPEG